MEEEATHQGVQAWTSLVGEEEAIFPCRVSAGRRGEGVGSSGETHLGQEENPDPFCRLLSDPGRSLVTNALLKHTLFSNKNITIILCISN